MPIGIILQARLIFSSLARAYLSGAPYNPPLLKQSPSLMGKLINPKKILPGSNILAYVDMHK